MCNTPNMGPGYYPDPWEDKMRASALRIEEHYRKGEVDLSKAMTWLEVSNNIKIDLQTRRVKIHFDEDKKKFYAMIPQVRASSASCDYRLRELFNAESFESETWTVEDSLIKLKVSFVSLPSGRTVDIILCKNDCSGKGLRKAFRKEGLTMQISQQYESAMYEDVFFCLISHATEKHVVFPHLGWNKTNGSWLFSSKTSEEVNVEGDSNITQVGNLRIEVTFKNNNLQSFFEGLLGYILHQDILKDMGLRLQTPVAIIYDTERTAEEVKRFLSTFVPVKEADSYISTKKLGKLIEKAYSEPIFYESGTGRYNEENIVQLMKWARSGQFDSKSAGGFPIAFFQSWIPDQWRDKVLAVSICEEDLLFVTFGYTEKSWLEALGCFSPHYVEQLCEEIRDNFKEESGNLKVLLSAYYFNTFFFRQPLEYELCHAKDAISMMLKNAETSAVIGVKEVFIDSLSEWVISQCYCECYQRFGGLSGVNLDQSILYDANFLYMPEYIFNQIIRPLKTQISSLEIKRILKEEGILICQKSEDYTVNLLLNPSEELGKHRYYRIDRQMIKKPGELDIVELCSLYKDN